MEDLEERAKSNGIEIAVRTNFLVDPANAVRNLKVSSSKCYVTYLFNYLHTHSLIHLLTH